MTAEIKIQEEYVAPLLICADTTGLSLEEIVEIALRFYLHRREENG